MTALFKKPKIEKPPPAPTIDDAARSDEMAQKLARRKGRMATLRSTGAGAPSVAVKQLLG